MKIPPLPQRLARRSHRFLSSEADDFSRRRLHTNNHSAFKLHYHLILTIKYRRQIIDNQIEQDLIDDFRRIAENYHITLDEANSDKDHIHFLFSTWPNSHLSKFINAYKAATSRTIKTKYPEIKNKLWKEKSGHPHIACSRRAAQQWT